MMKGGRRWLWMGLLVAFLALTLAACQSSTPSPVATTPERQEADVTEAKPEETEAPAATEEPQVATTEAPEETAEPVTTSEPAATEEGGEDPADQAQLDVERAKQLYVQLGCLSCHGANYEGRDGPMLVGLPVEEIKVAVRNGFPDAEEPMPAFSPQMISDEDLDLLAQFLSQLTLEDIGMTVPDEVVQHLQLAWESLEQEDRDAVTTHLQAALDALPEDEDYEGLKVTLEDLLEDVEEENWKESLEHHLVVLIGAPEHE